MPKALPLSKCVPLSTLNDSRQIAWLQSFIRPSTPMIKTLLFSISLAVAVFPSSIHAETRRALIIGNANYGDERLNLANPAKDAAKMEAALKPLGFSTSLLTDLDLPTLEEKVRQFMNQVVAGDTVLFFYAGHGLQVDGQNYLLPRAASITSATDVKYKAYDAQRIIEELEDRKAGLKILVLDCCRDNPLSRSVRSAKAGNGLARLEAAEGTVIAFSTAPGQVAADGDGDNSPYTEALAEVLATAPKEGLEIIAAFRTASAKVKASTGQIPWVNFDSSITNYFLRPPAGVVIETPPPVPVDMLKPLTVEGRETRLLRVADVSKIFKEHPDLSAASERMKAEAEAARDRLEEEFYNPFREKGNLAMAAAKESEDPALSGALRQEKKALAKRLSAEMAELELELKDFQKTVSDELRLLEQKEKAIIIAKIHASLLDEYSGSGLLIDGTNPGDSIPGVVGEFDLARPPKVIAVKLGEVFREHPRYAENAAAFKEMQAAVQEDLDSRNATLKDLIDKPNRTPEDAAVIVSLDREISDLGRRSQELLRGKLTELRSSLIAEIVVAVEAMRIASGADLVVNADSVDFAGRPFWVVGAVVPDATAPLLAGIKTNSIATVSPQTASLGVVTLEGAKLPENADAEKVENVFSDHARQLIAQLRPSLAENQIDLVACMSAEILPGQRFVISAPGVPQIRP